MMPGPSMGSERMSLAERAYRRLDSSMRARVLVPTALLFALTLAAMVAAAVHFYGADMERGRQERAEIFAGMVASGVSNVMLSGQPREVATFLDALVAHGSDLTSASLIAPAVPSFTFCSMKRALNL